MWRVFLEEVWEEGQDVTGWIRLMGMLGLLAHRIRIFVFWDIRNMLEWKECCRDSPGTNEWSQ